MTSTPEPDIETAERSPQLIEQAIARWAAENRPTFPHRAAYNLAICDRLALAGLQPSQSAVLRVGRWGQTTSVAADVALWYQRIAQRLDKRDDILPEQAREQANTLLLSLWNLARFETDQRIHEPLRQLNDRLALEVDQITEANQALDAQVEEQSTALTAAGADLAQCRTQLADTLASRDELALQLALRTRELENIVHKAQIEAAQHREALAAALSQRDAALREQQQAHQAQFMTLRDDLERRAREERIQLAIQLDEARQETHRAAARHKALEAQAIDLRESMTRERIAVAMAQAALTEVSAQRDALQAASAALHQRMESLSSDVAVLRKAAQALSTEKANEKSAEIPLQTPTEDER